MSTEHIKFITVGFADLIDNLPDIEPCPHCGMADSLLCICGRPDGNLCTECGRRIPPRAYWHSTPTALLPFCDEWCFTDWGQDQRLDDDAESRLDYRDDL